MLTHNEAIMPTIVTIEKAVTSLEEEKAALRMVVVGRDAEHTETLPLTKELLLSRVHAMLRGCLRKSAQRYGKCRYSLVVVWQTSLIDRQTDHFINPEGKFTDYSDNPKSRVRTLIYTSIKVLKPRIL